MDHHIRDFSWLPGLVYLKQYQQHFCSCNLELGFFFHFRPFVFLAFGRRCTAFKFRSNLSNGYLLEAQGSSTGYAATVGTALNDNGLQQVFFNSIGVSEDYVSCTQNAAGTPHLDCKVNDVLQQAIVCDDNWNNLYLVAIGDSYPE
ncbi:hypothetical protein KCU78_g824, partial [Aureobasidium melanogenum]